MKVLLAKLPISTICPRRLTRNTSQLLFTPTREVLPQTHIIQSVNFSYIRSDSAEPSTEQLYAVLRVDTHGNRFIMEQSISANAAKELERKFDQLTHHQGYYVVPQHKLAEELSRKL